jgi:DNA-binding GntR family transcriptional regulator
MKRALTPGQSITDSSIANELNMSRTPVREALRRLDHEGFLINQTGRGWKVYSLSLEDIREIFDIKLQMEGMIAKKAAESKDETKRASLKAALKCMKEASDANDLKAWQKADMELHGMIFSMCANKRASKIIYDLNNQWYRVRIGLIALEGRMQRSTVEHEVIIKSILNCDGDSAESNMRQHLSNVQEELENVLVNLVLPFAQNGI